MIKFARKPNVKNFASTLTAALTKSKSLFAAIGFTLVAKALNTRVKGFLNL